MNYTPRLPTLGAIFVTIRIPTHFFWRKRHRFPSKAPPIICGERLQVFNGKHSHWKLEWFFVNFCNPKAPTTNKLLLEKGGSSDSSRAPVAHLDIGGIEKDRSMSLKWAMPRSALHTAEGPKTFPKTGEKNHGILGKKLSRAMILAEKNLGLYYSEVFGLNKTENRLIFKENPPPPVFWICEMRMLNTHKKRERGCTGEMVSGCSKYVYI